MNACEGAGAPRRIPLALMPVRRLEILDGMPAGRLRLLDTKEGLHMNACEEVWDPRRERGGVPLIARDKLQVGHYHVITGILISL